MTVVFTASTDFLSAEHTSRFLLPFLHWLNPDVSAATIAQIHFLLRKGGHLVEYAILAVLLWRGFRPPQVNVRHGLWPSAAIALAVALLFAATDEWHQTFVPSRGPSLADVLIDSCGALLGLTLRWTIGDGEPKEKARE